MESIPLCHRYKDLYLRHRGMCASVPAGALLPNLSNYLPYFVSLEEGFHQLALDITILVNIAIFAWILVSRGADILRYIERYLPQSSR